LRNLFWIVGLLGVLLCACSAPEKTVQTKPTLKKEATTEAQNTEYTVTFFNANKEKLSGNFESAAVGFQRCIELQPAESAAYYELARIYEQQNKLEAALPLATKAKNIDPKNIWYQTLYAQLNGRLGKFEEAIKSYQHIIKENPDAFDYYFQLAGTYIYKGDYDSAIKIFNDIESRVGVNEEVSLQKQMLYMEMGKNKEAIAEVQKLIALNPSELQYLGILAELYDKNGERDKAAKIYEQMLAMDEESGMIHLSLSEFYRNSGDLEKSFIELKKAFASKDLGIDGKINILLNYYSETELNSALINQAYELCEVLEKTHPDDAKSYSIYGDYLYRDERFEESRAKFQSALKFDKSRFVIWNQVLILDSQLNDFESMEKNSREAMELFPTMPSFYLFSGIANIQKKKYEEAVEVLNLGVDLVVGNFLQLAQFYASLGDAYHYLDMHKESDEAYDNSLGIQDNNSYVLNNYAYYLSLRKEKLDLAEKMAKKANELQPDEASFQDTYAWVLYQLGKYDLALEWLDKALNNGGINDGTVLEHYGDVLFKLNRQQDALSYWKKAKEKGGASDLLEKKIADKKLHE
jgi:tetratricopeptide (TPR) repeat protein